MLEHVKLLEEAFDKRNNELWWNCNQVYFLADIRVYAPEELEGTEKEKEYCDLSKGVNLMEGFIGQYNELHIKWDK